MPELPKRARLSDQLIVHFSREIIGERLKPGEPLPPETELAARFGISKVVARESLHALTSFGLVRRQQGKRTVVLDKSEWDVLAPVIQQAYWLEGHAAALIRQIYELRLALEPAAAAWAAERATPESLSELTSLVEDMRTIANTSRNVLAFLSVDRAFHDTVAKATGNIIVRGVMRNLHISLSGGWSRSQVMGEDLGLVAEQHAQIATGIKSRNATAARRAMETHVRWAEQIETDRTDRIAQGVSPESTVRPAVRIVPP